MQAPASWDAAFSLRACELCDHRAPGSTEAAAELHCACPSVTCGSQPVPCSSVRGRGGVCGPDAHHFHWPAIELRAA